MYLIVQKWCDGMSEYRTIVISIAWLVAVSLPKPMKGVAGMAEALTGVMLSKRPELRLQEKRGMYMLKTVEGRKDPEPTYSYSVQYCPVMKVI
jgi:hypothetical protein